MVPEPWEMMGEGTPTSASHVLDIRGEETSPGLGSFTGPAARVPD